MKQEAVMNRTEALDLLRQYNKQRFHLQHAFTVEKVLGWFAEQLGFQDEKPYWEMVGLLHDLDYETHPEQHCELTPVLLREAGFDEAFITSVLSHGYLACAGCPAPVHTIEKVLYAVDELTGLIGAAALMRPSKSVQDMELKSLKKKYKDKSFAAGCSREVIQRGADILGWDLDRLLQDTLNAMKAVEADIATELEALD
ncbi:MAG: hydrolase [Clostridiales bacterium]|nr:hydrolase [Clostridiales bacterium]